ncbi:YozE SAM-like fold [Paenibacillus tianmuensis]|uniref:YozE SAM-like fold n=1 Tax=Paenibacillus tianmuensis TaxID=624147 RepID=A0A1G4TXQ0_9BACL|nr:VRR-NUC domain-containing protein [Paenibacillus tianmuensis]SCW86192.1 YozE SAM-like fold [Paenibacillus tianmuensis]
MQDYKTWIASRLDAVGPLGDIARMVHTDAKFPETSDKEKIRQWLEERAASERLMIAFIGTWKFYLADARKKPREASLENTLAHEVKRCGGLCWKFVSPGTVGVPDRIVITPDGRVAFVEMKAPGGKLQPIQRKRAQELQERNANWYCLKSNQDIAFFLEEMFGDGI